MRTRSGWTSEKKYINGRLISRFCKTHKITPRQINLGYCYKFAVLLHKLYNAELAVCRCGTHAWTIINGMHYDSDNPDGKPGSLCYCNQYSIRDYSLFTKCWNSVGRSGPIDEISIDSLANRIKSWKFYKQLNARLEKRRKK